MEHGKGKRTVIVEAADEGAPEELPWALGSGAELDGGIIGDQAYTLACSFVSFVCFGDDGRRVPLLYAAGAVSPAFALGHGKH